MVASGTFRLDPRDAGWRLVDGHALVVSRSTGHLHRLGRRATAIWEVLVGAPDLALDLDAIEEALAGAAPTASRHPNARAELELFLRDLVRAGLLRGESSGAAPVHGHGDQRPQQRRIDGAWQIVERIAPTPAAVGRRVGGGILLRFPDGTVSLLSGEAALLWKILTARPRTYAELLDALIASRDLSYQDAERVAAPLLAGWIERGALHGLERVESFPAVWKEDRVPDSCPPASAPAADPATIGVEQRAARDLGRLEVLQPGAPPAARGSIPRLGAPSTLRDAAGEVEHVAIVCQYGIQGLAPGVEPYSQRCIARLRRLEPDLVILSGGGRHGSSPLREAESVIGRYLEQLPAPGLWLEKHSTTTWENLQYSLEMLSARSIVPARVSLLGDRARAEKLRLACALAKRRFGAFQSVAFRVVPVPRPRFTWRDTRAIQVVLGTVQILEESRGKRLRCGAATSDPAPAGRG